MSILSVLRHKEATESDIQGSSEAFQLVFRHCCVFSTCTTIVATSTLSTFEQVPVCSDQEFFRLLKFSTSHANICLSKDEIGREQFNRFLIEDLLLDCLAHSVINNLVGILVLVMNDVLLSLLDSKSDLISLSSAKEVHVSKQSISCNAKYIQTGYLHLYVCLYGVGRLRLHRIVGSSGHPACRLLTICLVKLTPFLFFQALHSKTLALNILL